MPEHEAIAFVTKTVTRVGYALAKISARGRRASIETHEQKDLFVELTVFGVARLILDIAWQWVYERCCQVAPHVLRGSRKD